MKLYKGIMLLFLAGCATSGVPSIAEQHRNADAICQSRGSTSAISWKLVQVYSGFAYEVKCEEAI